MLFSCVVIFLLGLLPFSLAQKDPLKQFCRIHGHQVAVVDNNFYVDGGMVNWSPLTADSINYTSTWLRRGDFNENNAGFPQMNLASKNDTVPSVQGGILWADEVNKAIYQYGGEYNNEKPEELRLWMYDTIYDTWNITNTSTTNIQRAAWGAGATVQDKAVGYYYGGYLTGASVPGYKSQTPLSSMLVYNMLDHTFTNQSGPDNVPRAEGSMVYIPAGDAGLLVYFGGVEYVNETRKAMPMTDIHLYDIANNLWYKQNASGSEIPGDRRRFCAGAAWAEDRSSYNIYLYGGASVDEGVGYGGVWTLSLPSFTWIKFYPDNELPHHSLSCTVYGNSQMIIMGGHFPNRTSDCDVPSIYGQHGLHFGNTEQGQPWGNFDPKITSYKVPPVITKTIGGDSKGSATLSEPTSGFGHNDLKIQFGRAYTPAARTPTRNVSPATSQAEASAAPPPQDDNKAVIGGAVGGALGGVALISAVGAFLLLRRRKKAKQVAHVQERQPSPDMSQRHFSQGPPDYVHTPHGSPTPVDYKHVPFSPQSVHSDLASPYGYQQSPQHFAYSASSAGPSELAGTDILELPTTQKVAPVEMPGNSDDTSSVNGLSKPPAKAVAPVEPDNSGSPSDTKKQGTQRSDK